MTEFNNFVGRAKRLENTDLPRIASSIGVGEDELHAFMDVESRGHGFDSLRRPIILFEPHIFYRLLSGAKLAEAVGKGLAYKKWGTHPYPSDSYPRLRAALAIDETAALSACSWGLTQVLGLNHRMCGYATVQAMVLDFMDDEDNHVEAMVKFIVASGIDDEMRALARLTRATQPADCVGIVAVYNGPGYKKNNYHVNFARAHNKWRKIPDTPWNPVEPEVEVPMIEPVIVEVPPSVNVPQTTGTAAGVGLVVSAFVPWLGLALLVGAVLIFIAWKMNLISRIKAKLRL